MLDMAGRCGGAPGGVIRTYARLRPLRRVDAQTWFSPPDRKHLFSSSSSHLESTCDASSSGDPDFIPTKRKERSSCRGRRPEKPTSRRKKKPLQPPRRSRRKCLLSPSPTDEEKENDDKLLPASHIVFSTPFRKFVTLRRKAAEPGVTMRPVSGKPRREASPLLSPDSGDFEADSRTLKKRKRRRRRRMCTDVTNLLSSSADTLPSPLQKPPLLCSTPSMMLTAVPRKGDAFVRQLALCEALEDSVVVCGVDSESCVGNEPPPSLREGLPCRVSHEVRSMEAPASSHGLSPSPMAAGAERYRDGAGSGVKRLLIRPGSDHKLPAICLLSPEMVSSPKSPSVVLIGEETSSHQEQSDGLDASAELFSGDFTIDKEENPGSEPRPPLYAPHKEGGSPSIVTPSRWQDFSRKQFQPFIRLNSRSVAEYFRLQSKCRLRETSVQDDCDTSGTTTPTMEPALSRRRPLVSLDSAAVSKYLLQKEKTPEEPRAAPPQDQASAILSCLSPASKTPQITTSGSKTPQITTSLLKNSSSAAPHALGTGRKVCISGFSAKRWGTLRKVPATKTHQPQQQQLSFQDCSREDPCGGDAQHSLLFSPSLLTSSFMNSTAVMNLNLSTESLIGRDPQKEHQRWARLRAALTLHRRKKVEAGSLSLCPVERNKRGKTSLGSQNSSLLLLSPFQSPLLTHELSDAEKVFAECQQERPVPFYQCLSWDQLRCCQKVGEGVYGEVFRTLRKGQHVALKVIPIEGSQKVNGEHQKSFAEILPEIIISKELSLLSDGEENQTSGFIQLHSAHCVQGSYPPELLSAWDAFAEEKGTENERPDLFGPGQLFMILEFEFGGEDLERVSSKLPSVASSRSILHQVTAALAVAEEELRFEHRDLHWGNLLIEKSPSSTISVSLRGEIFHIPNAGIQVKIIDYTLSRLDKDGLTVFCDLSTDEELFLGEGDLQFDVYRRMRQENQNLWSSYKPHSNVLWLHYLCDKLLSEVKYIKKPTSAPQRRELRRLQDFRREVQQFESATDVLKRSRLFK